MWVKVLSWLLALLFLFAGVTKLLGLVGSVEGFEKMGYSSGFRLLIGVIETAGGVGLLMPALRRYAALGLVVIMIGAVWSLIGTPESPVMPGVVGLLLALIAAVDFRR
jgi:putative oxidoreductase